MWYIGPHEETVAEGAGSLQGSRRHKDGPVALDRALAFEEVEEHRNLYCGRYAMCLEVVVRRQWVSFTCRHCSLWHRRPQAEERPHQPATVLHLPAVCQR